MAEEKGYQGWKNYETWAVKLWIDNDRGSYEYWRERARVICAEPEENEVWTVEQRRRFQLADELKDECNEGQPDLPNVYGDLLGAALEMVDWNEIAESMLEEVHESEEVSR